MKYHELTTGKNKQAKRVGRGIAAGRDARTDDDLESGIAQVQRVRAALAAVANDGDRLA